MRVPEQVDARQRRRAERERALAVHAATPWRRELDEIRDGPGAALLRQADQLQQDLRGRLGVGQRAVAGTRARAEELRERGEANPRLAPREHPTREPHGVDDRRGEPPVAEAQHRGVEERDVETRVVRDEHGVAGELDEPSRGERSARCTPQLAVVDAGQRRDLERQPLARVDERLERVRQLEALDARGADLADPRAARREPGRLQVDDAERRLLEQHALGVRDRERNAASSPGEPRVVADDVVEQRTRHALRHVPECEERARRVLDGNGATPFLDELDQPIRRVEPELHGRIVRERMFVCNGKRKAATDAASRSYQAEAASP